MILEFIEGKTLASFLSQEEVFTLSDQIAVANKICRAVEILHIDRKSVV
mgnify:CR=1 FL=1